MAEVWKPVVGSVGAYEVSSAGRVRSLDRRIETKRGPYLLKGRVLKDVKAGKGYRRVSIGEGNPKYVHQLVLEAFIGPRPDGMECCHNNGDPADNQLDNLRYDTASNNNRDKVRHGTDYNASKTHCRRGHEYTAENTVRRPDGTRKCRACRNAQARQAMKKKASTPEGRAALAAKSREWRHRTGKVTGLHNYGSRTHCKNGHEFTPENTVPRADGGRRCRACRNQLTAKRNRQVIERRKNDPQARAEHNAYMREWYRRKTKAKA